MKRVILLLILVVNAFAGSGQDVVYDQNAEVRTVDNFSSIELSGAISLYLSQGTTQGVAISASDAKYNEKIKTEVKDGVLKVFTEGGGWNVLNWGNRKLRAYVTVTDVKRIAVSGASYVSTTGPLKSEDLMITLSGASEIKGIINVSKLNLILSGASVSRLSGTAKQATVEASGACKVSSYDLVVENCKASSSGASNIRVTVTGELTAEASGGSTIYYKGPGVAKSVEAAGGASIRNRGGNDD